MSLAQNGLLRVPTDALEMTNITLQYLSLAGNNFNILFAPNVNTSFYNWSTFPLMLTLKELDLRNCSIDSLDENIFRNLPQLEHLFLAHNLFKRVASSAFMYLSKLTHLDISYNNYYRDKKELVLTDNGELFLPENAFQNLSELFFLDFSHTKLLPESIKAFSTLGSKMEQLSLCYTDISTIPTSMFNGANIKVLDLSGNQDLSKSLHHSAFKGLESKLEVLVFGDSNLKHLRYFKNLGMLRMLDLRNNYIVDVNSSFFRRLPNLEILDLRHNLIEIWKVRIFYKNHKLSILNLRSNKINYLSSEMIEDFADVKFLAIGDNNFICTCILREFIDKAIRNARDFHCPNSSGLEDLSVQ